MGTPPVSQPPRQSSAAATSGDRQTQYPVTITDCGGRTTTYDKAPERAVTIGPSVTEMLRTLGLKDKIVGYTEFFTPDQQWATGHQAYQPAHPLLAYPDAGPAVTFYVRRTCCVLHKTPGPHACPACPQYPDDATRLQKIDEWLAAMPDDDFRQVTWRGRMAYGVGS